MRISAVAGGASQQAVIGTADPAALEVVRPLLSKLDAIAGEVHKRPVASLALTADFPAEGIKVGKVSLRIALVFRNGGSEGVYISHPAAALRCALSPSYEKRTRMHCTLTSGVTERIARGLDRSTYSKLLRRGADGT